MLDGAAVWGALELGLRVVITVGITKMGGRVVAGRLVVVDCTGEAVVPEPSRLLLPGVAKTK